MTVKELIKVLSKMPQDCEVRICSTDSPYYKDGCHVTMGLLENIKVVDIFEGYSHREVIITNGNYYHK